MTVRRNAISNYAGQGWSALMALAFVPLYVRHLGIEAYGLIGLFATIQAWLALFDLGIAPTLHREMARFSAGAYTSQGINDLLRTLELLSLVIASAAAVVLWWFCPFIAEHWLNSNQLPLSVVTNALQVTSVVIALRFFESIYRSSLVGLQQQVEYNALNASLVTLRHGGAAILVAYVSPSIEHFFIWQGAMSLLTLIVLRRALISHLPTSPHRPAFSRSSIKDVWHFAVGMIGITCLSLTLTQVDKVLLSRLLTLEQFGHYVLAGTVAAVIYTAVGPIVQAVYPRMVEVFQAGDTDALAHMYHRSAQLVTVLTAPIAVLLVLFPREILFVWSGDTLLAQNVGPLLAILALGTFLHSLMWVPYHLQLASGWTRLAVQSNTVAVIILVPCLLFAVNRFGVRGAAAVWVVLNVGYIAFVSYWMHRRLLPGEQWNWFLGDVLQPSVGPLIIGALALVIAPSSDSSRLIWLLYLSLVAPLTCVAAILTASHPRRMLLSRLRAS